MLILNKKLNKVSLLIITFCLFFSVIHSQTEWARYTGNPVLVPGGPCTWDENISVVNSVLFHEGIYKMWYGGSDVDLFQTGYATSELLVSVEDEEDIRPTEFLLYQNYPNPFNPSTRIKFTISELRFTILKVYDILGNEVATLVNEELPAGEYEVEFNAGKFTSGIYFYQLKVGEFIETKKMILLK